MATRFYFPADTAADVSPAFDSNWTTTASAVRRKLVATKGSSPIAIGSTISFGQTEFGLDRMYVSDPLGAQTLLGTAFASMQLMTREFASTDNVDYVVTTIHVVSNDGSTVKHTLLGFTGWGTFGNEFINNATCRNNSAISGAWDFGTNGSAGAGNDYTIDDGDRLVLEIGYALSTSSGTTPQAAAKYGENATDLPVNDTQTTDGAGWLEISQTLTFSGTVHAGAADMSATVTMAANGIRQANGAADMNVVVTGSANGTRQANGASAMNAVVTVSADGTRQANGAVAMNIALTVAATGRIPPPPMVMIRAYAKASSQPVASVSGSGQPTGLSVAQSLQVANTKGSEQPSGVVRAASGN